MCYLTGFFFILGVLALLIGGATNVTPPV